MKNKYGLKMVYAGNLLIMLSFCISIYNACEDYMAGNSAKTAVLRIEAIDISQTEEIPLYISHPDIEMPTETIDGYDYIGIFEVPSINLTLPVISRWSYPALKTAPCRYMGSVYKDNMIIAAHDYRRHFAPLKNLPEKTEVVFTDMAGNRFEYVVTLKEILEPSAVEELVSGQWDLTLFTCTSDALHRVVIRCEKL